MYKVFIFFNLSYFLGTQKNHLKRLAKQHLTLCTLVHSEDPDEMQHQGSKIALVRSYLRVPKAAGQVEILILLMKMKYFPIYANNFVMQGKCLF